MIAELLSSCVLDFPSIWYLNYERAVKAFIGRLKIPSTSFGALSFRHDLTTHARY